MEDANQQTRRTRTRRIVASGVFGLVLVGLLVVAKGALALAPGQGDALGQQIVGLEVSSSACLKTGPLPSFCPQEPTARALKETDESFISPAVSFALVNILLELTGFVLDRLAYESAVFVATAGEGETPLFSAGAESAWKTFGLDIAGEAIGLLSEDILNDEFELQFNLCRPNDFRLNVGIAIGIRQAFRPRPPRCDFREIQANWNEFLNSARAIQANPSKFVLAEFAKGLRPGQNELSVGILANITVIDNVDEKKRIKFGELLSNEGFSSVTDFITGKVETPAALYRRQVEANIIGTQQEKRHGAFWAALFTKDVGLSLLSRTTSVFTNTLLSSLLEQLYDGLVEDIPTPDLLNPEFATNSGIDARQEQFERLITPSPIAEADFNVLTDFVVCPVGSVISRGINNCVMDQDLLRAVSTAASGIPMTVSEALENDLLHKDWILVPPDDVARNQDPFCFQSAYCYGNLVKMRKARILPVGWEIAAQQNATRRNNPATLGEIVDAFNDCNADGALDRSHPFCHLIDPNWVLKFPETQCRATATGEILVSEFTNARATSCVDTPSCVDENPDGSCGGGYGYCVREKNVWRFRGDECPAHLATCLAFENTQTGEQKEWLLNSADFSVCGEDNAGCRWYRTNRYFDDKGTEDTEDDSFEFLPTEFTYAVADRDNDIRFGSTQRDELGIDEGVARFAYEDRLYLTHAAEACVEQAAGCSELYVDEPGLSLNVIANPSFEEDIDADGTPDDWQRTNRGVDGGYETDGAGFFGESAVQPVLGMEFVQRDIVLSANSFYSLSVFAQGSGNGGITVEFKDALTGEADGVNLVGTSSRGNCTLVGQRSYVFEFPNVEEGEYKRYNCTFTTAGVPLLADIRLEPSGIMFDALQLEPQEQPSAFTIGYNTSSPQQAYLKVPPSYLNCQGLPTDPAECDNYAQVCRAQQAGCELYTPEQAGPAVPAVLSSGDLCPTECVGYGAFKQEETRYEAQKFPVAFIPTDAVSCSAQHVGCDSFTNLDTVAQGGEGVEHFTQLRACVDGDNSRSRTFFTWEGSDAEGYQLRTWQLLGSDMTNGTQIVFTQDTDGDGQRDVIDGDDDNNPDTPELEIFDETRPDLAPCTYWQMTDEATLVCRDSQQPIATFASDDACNQHEDILTNPDCREFYDTDGTIHYRRMSEVVFASAACHPYRKTESTQSDCQRSGGFWTSAGECRYLGIASESTSCPAVANGCRAYTGGAGRNTATIFTDAFESGTTANFESELGVSTTYSNESIATDGHSMRVVTRGIDQGVHVLQAYMPGRSICTDGEGCDIDGQCSVLQGDSSCGPLTKQIVPGKTYLLEFWAKGSGAIFVEFAEEGADSDIRHSFVDPDQGGSLELTGAWQRFTLGPVDTSADGFDGFDANAVLRFASAEGGEQEFFIDNILLRQAEENITIVKDSWVVPSTCDTAPDGTSAPQFYLGCEAYSDRAGGTVSVHQFSSLCSEDVVGCQRFYDTQNSVEGERAPYGRTHNASCQFDTNDDPFDGEVVSSNTDCVIDGVTYCTITVGRESCRFDDTGPLALPLRYDTDTNFRLVLGPEAVVVQNDVPVYLVANDRGACSVANVGCEEVGVPVFAQDKETVTSFESTYVINHPDRYEGQSGQPILCEHEALFCEAWSTTNEGTYYFKDPLEKECEYKTNVTIGNQPFFGWFRRGTTEPCDWIDVNGNDSFDLGIDDVYLIGGEEFGIWRNGDERYDGWAGVCERRYDLCTEFVDPTDTSEGQYPEGSAYYFINNERLSEDGISTTQKCRGRVSQKSGCVLFTDRNESELRYAAGPSYVASVHADELFGGEPDDLRDPVSCETIEEGEILPPGIGQEPVNLCLQRCRYEVGEGNAIKLGNGVRATDRAFEYGGACFTDSDCPVLETLETTLVSGSCVTIPEEDQEAARWYNDTNTILKVKRDRTCAQWLACSSGQTSWDEHQGKFVQICDSVDLCAEFGAAGGEECANWIESEPLVLTPERYSARDVSWNGLEYAGYAIPNSLPIEHYRQANVNPNKWCVSQETGTPALGETRFGERCNTNADCDEGFDCRESAPDNRLVHIAGPCEESLTGRGGSCSVGTCEDSNNACSRDADCGRGDRCIVGACQFVIPDTQCTTDAECGGFGFCDFGRCVRHDPENNDNYCTPQDTGSCAPDEQCVPLAQSKIGACFNDQCLTTTFADPQTGATRSIVPERFLAFEYTAEAQSCRGYPEPDAPYSSQEIVDSWTGALDGNRPHFDETSGGPEEIWSRPFEKRFGFNNANTCAPITGVKEGVVTSTSDCLCSYEKVVYDQGTAFRYYPNPLEVQGTTFNPDTDILSGVCLGGALAGFECFSDDECQTNEDRGGTCITRSGSEKHFGWTGFCIERDTSINIFNNQDEYACLTWLPVDQLSGSTDLFAKYIQAGFGPADAYYCAETDTTYTLKSTGNKGSLSEGSGYACAETKEGFCSNRQGYSNYVTDESCWKGQHCPHGYFKVITGCDGGAPKINNDDDFACDSVDDDCPFFCVPKFSFHTEDGSDETYKFKRGDACLPPADAQAGIEVGDRIGNAQYKVPSKGKLPKGANQADEDAYFIGKGQFFAARDHYADCETRGLTLDAAAKYFGPTVQVGIETYGGTTLSWPRGNDGSTDGWRGLNVKVEPALACQSLVQVGSSNFDPEFGGFNTAWTNRTFESNRVEISSDQAVLNYETGTDRYPFGIARGKDAFLTDRNVKFDPYPQKVLHCKANSNAGKARQRLVLPDVEGVTCPDGYSLVQESEARSYQEVAHDCSEVIEGIRCCTSVSDNDFEGQGNECEVFTSMEDDEEGVNRARCELTEVFPIQEIERCRAAGIVAPEQPENAVGRLGQIFARAWRLFNWTDGSFIDTDFENHRSTPTFETLMSQVDNLNFGDYEEIDIDDWAYDQREDGDPESVRRNRETPDVPVIASVGACERANCQEGQVGKFSVNGIDEGIIDGAEGRKHVQVSFFAYAHREQMPIRNVIVDWGDGERDDRDSKPWPTNSQSGSQSNNNFYKNHRGIGLGGSTQCDDSEWGRTHESCDTSYLSYTHNYRCSDVMVDPDLSDGGELALPVCQEDQATGRLLNSPCREGNRCIFQPRVHVVDNWGWCTGVCTAGDDGTDECYGRRGDVNVATPECDFSFCPSEGNDPRCLDGRFLDVKVNPWINFDGKIRVEPFF